MLRLLNTTKYKKSLIFCESERDDFIPNLCLSKLDFYGNSKSILIITITMKYSLISKQIPQTNGRANSGEKKGKG